MPDRAQRQFSKRLCLDRSQALFQKAAGTKPVRTSPGQLSSAFTTGAHYSDRSVGRSPAATFKVRYAKRAETLRLSPGKNGQQVTQLIINLLGAGHCVGDLSAQQLPAALA